MPSYKRRFEAMDRVERLINQRRELPSNIKAREIAMENKETLNNISKANNMIKEMKSMAHNTEFLNIIKKNNLLTPAIKEASRIISELKEKEMSNNHESMKRLDRNLRRICNICMKQNETKQYKYGTSPTYNICDKCMEDIFNSEAVKGINETEFSNIIEMSSRVKVLPDKEYIVDLNEPKKPEPLKPHLVREGHEYSDQKEIQEFRDARELLNKELDLNIPIWATERIDNKLYFTLKLRLLFSLIMGIGCGLIIGSITTKLLGIIGLFICWAVSFIQSYGLDEGNSNL